MCVPPAEPDSCCPGSHRGVREKGGFEALSGTWESRWQYRPADTFPKIEWDEYSGVCVMAQEERSRLAEWYEAGRSQLPVIRRHVDEWFAAVREDPNLIWETPAVRYTTYGLGGVILMWLASAVPGMFIPPLPPSARAEATTADYHVVCANPQCENHFVIHREFEFAGFPVDCARCGGNTGQPARRCSSGSCRGRWVVPIESGTQLSCPRCGDRFR